MSKYNNTKTTFIGLALLQSAVSLPAAVLFTDDFNDGSIDSAKWTPIATTGTGTGWGASPGGSTVVESGGSITISQSATDNGGGLQSATITVTDTGLITIDRKTKVHYNGNRVTQYEHLFSSSGARLLRWGYFNYGTTYLGFGSFEDSRLTGVWDQWISETISYDPATGAASYTINGTYDMTGNLTPSGAGTVVITSGVALPDGDTDVYLRMGAYGWFTGHTKELDSMTVSQIPEPSTIGFLALALGAMTRRRR